MTATDNDSTASLAGLGPSSRVADAYKDLIRYIHRHRLGEGGRLPTQEELRGELGYSHHSLSAAMGLLADGGVVSRKPRVGTIVQDPEATVRGVWTVGLITQPREVMEVPFFAFLVHLLQSELIRLGCRVHMYPNADDSPSDRLQDFPGLLEEVEANRVDGVMATVLLRPGEVHRLAETGVVLVQVGPSGACANGVCIDRRSMCRRAAESLIAEGCRRLAVVTNFGPPSEDDGFWRGFREALGECEEYEGDGEALYEGNGPEAGAEVAQQLLGRPAVERPDGLIIGDDRIAMGLTAELSRTEDYRPRIAVQANRQVPLAFALPVRRYCVDIEAMARLGAEKMLRQLRNPAAPDAVTWVEPGREGERAEIRMRNEE